MVTLSIKLILGFSVGVTYEDHTIVIGCGIIKIILQK